MLRGNSLTWHIPTIRSVVIAVSTSTNVLKVWHNIGVIIIIHPFTPVGQVTHKSYPIEYVQPLHGAVIKRKHFPRYWPFMRGIHRSAVDSHNKAQWHGALMLSLIGAWTIAWLKLWRGRWFEAPSHSLWRHCNDEWIQSCRICTSIIKIRWSLPF